MSLLRDLSLDHFHCVPVDYFTDSNGTARAMARP
jgi:hypothetical protein